MTTGSSPSFLDVILNIADSDKASNLSHEDTWLSRLKGADRGKMVFYGENTWLQLFPDIFDRSEGASAFYVPVRLSERMIMHRVKIVARGSRSAI